MKKLVVIVIMVIMTSVLAVASANDDPIWNNVYDFWKELHEEYKLFTQTEYGSYGFSKDNIAYYGGNNCAVYYIEKHTIKEIEDYINETCVNANIKHYTYTVTKIGNDDEGRDALHITIMTTEDLSKNKNVSLSEYGEEIYGINMICYDRLVVD